MQLNFQNLLNKRLIKLFNQIRLQVLLGPEESAWSAGRHKKIEYLGDFITILGIFKNILAHPESESWWCFFLSIESDDIFFVA